MFKHFLLLLALFSVSLSTTSYDYYTLEVEWAGSVCKTRTCSQLSQTDKSWFNIHGLWPDANSGNHPAFCQNSSVFAWSKLSSTTQSEITKQWNGLYSSTDDFLSHEWSKHGTCWNDNTGGTNKMEDYFATALDIAQSIDVYTTLAMAGITPGKNYTLSAIQKALSESYGVIGITCQSGLLISVDVCLDLEYHVMDCKSAKVSGCSSTVQYPSHG